MYIEHCYVMWTTFMIRPSDYIVLNDPYFKTTCNIIIAHLLASVGGLKLEGPLYIYLWCTDPECVWPCICSISRWTCLKSRQWICYSYTLLWLVMMPTHSEMVGCSIRSLFDRTARTSQNTSSIVTGIGYWRLIFYIIPYSFFSSEGWSFKTGSSVVGQLFWGYFTKLASYQNLFCII